MFDEAEVLSRFGFHPATDVTRPLHEQTRVAYKTLAQHILKAVPVGRHQALALTALQEAAMWTNAGIAIDLAPEE